MSTLIIHLSRLRCNYLVVLASVAVMTSQQNAPETGSYFSIPGLNRTAYVQRGDINVGIFLGIYTSSSSANFRCDNLAVSEFTLQKTEAMSYVTQKVNNDTSMLANVSLGFVVLDECGHPNTVLAQSLTFLPRRGTGTTGENYDVIGVVSPSRSDWTSPISQLYSTVKLPIMGYKTGSDELTDKYKHRYFMRVVPPDKYQVTAMLHFIREMNWSYISVLYHAGNYGEPPFENIKLNAPNFGVCIAASHKVDELTDLRPVLKDLMDIPRARVVILFTNIQVVFNLMVVVREFNASGHFVWIGSNAWAGSATASLKDFSREVAGGFVFQQVYARVPDFEKFYRAKNPYNSPNPWMPRAWELLYNCSMTSGTCRNVSSERDLAFADDLSHLINAVLAFSYAANRLLQNECPAASGSDARACITGELFLRYLLNTTFQSYTGLIHFDDKGDMTGTYWIKQIVPELSGNLIENNIATFDITAKSIVFFENHTIFWNCFHQLARVVPLHQGQPVSQPESMCSSPCHFGEFRIPKKLECCWDCRTCREYERILHEKASCEPCPTFTWPNPDTNLTTCQPIPLSHPSFTGTMSIIFISLAVFAILSLLVVLGAYIYLWEERVIKASSRELSILQLTAIFVGYLTVILFQVTPSPGLCSAIYFTFCLSFAWLYSPLLVKAVRIFRIFQSGIKCNRRPWFVSSKSQVVMATILITLQVIICISISMTFQPSSRLTQPLATEKFVELSCDLTLPGLVSFLAYNMVLVILCSVFAFMTRKLPDNFNESRFMSMCVSTTLVIWLAFIPTYLTAIYQYVKVLLLSAALLLNHTVALVFLFLPKLYAGICLPSEPVTANTSHRFQTALGNTRSTLHPHSGQVAPREFTIPVRQGF